MSSLTVFISYNHKDGEIAERIRDWLENQKVEVIMDRKDMKAGTFIQSFIDESIRDCDAILSLISRNSLRSGWVGIESMEGIFATRLLGTSILPIDLDGAYLENNIVDSISEEIEQRLAEISNQRTVRERRFQGTEDLDAEQSRLINLMKNLPLIISRLRSVLTIPFQVSELETGMIKIHDALLPLPGRPQGGKSEKQADRLSLYHKYTCDRYEQYSGFEKYYLNQKKLEKAHFFYIHGGDRHAHSGLFRRIVYFMKESAHRQVEHFEIELPLRSQLDDQKIAVQTVIFEELGIVDTFQEPLEKKKLGYSLEAPASSLYGLTAESRVCFLLTINEYHWQTQTMEELATWFIEAFCGTSLAADGPDFYFFFAIEYSVRNTTIQEEIRDALSRAKYTNILPELMEVEKWQIEQWFREHKRFWRKARERDAAFDAHFLDEPDKMYMEDVQDVLEDVIIKLNNSEANANRDS